MYKPRFILRSLLLVFLVGWLGIAQPTEAQQTVTLSGRVTDAAGNAVSGAFVSLERLPGWVWAGQETDGNGAYRLSVPPGLTVLRVWPQRATYCPKYRRADGSRRHTIRSIVLEKG